MKNFNTYQINLEKSLKQKMFFTKYINIKDYDFILDFGCGTGIILNEIKKLNDKATLVGYDENPEMLKLCNEKYGNNTEQDEILFTNNLKLIKKNLSNYKNKLIIFSSVMHEMKEFEQLDAINSLMPLFDTIVIRDMKRPLNNEPISNRTRKRVLKQVGKWQAELFETKWGKIKDKIDLYRFFLMNEFVDNFESEVYEDYFGTCWSQIDWSLDDMGYKAIHRNSYTLPYRKKQVQKVFKHNMCDITHREVIYVKEK